MASVPSTWIEHRRASDRERVGWLREDGSVEPVRLVEVTPEHIRFKTEDFEAINAPVTVRALPWPAPAGLRLRP